MCEAERLPYVSLFDAIYLLCARRTPSPAHPLLSSLSSFALLTPLAQLPSQIIIIAETVSPCLIAPILN